MSVPAEPDEARTIGVAIAIPPPFAPELQRCRQSFGDPMAEAIPPHVTLLPPTEVGVDELPVIYKHLSAVASNADPFDIHLRGTATFRPVSPVVFVGVVEGIAGCELLAEAVRSGPLAVEVDFPYHPHVTIAHDLPEEALDRAFEELAGYRTHFQVTEFWLYVHDPVEGWQPTRSFPLSAAVPG